MAVSADSNFIYSTIKQQGGYGNGYPPSGIYWWGISVYPKPIVNATTPESEINIEPKLFPGGLGWQTTTGNGDGAILLVVNGTMTSSPLLGLAVANGVIYVAESTNNSIKLFNATTLSSTPIGNWAVSQVGPLSADRLGLIFIFQECLT